MGPNAPEVMKVRDVYEQLDSPLLGFVADFSSTMHAMSPTLLRAVRKAGLDDASVERMQQIWATDAPMRERQQEFIGYLQSRDFDPGRLGSFAHLAFNMHGHVDPREWADIMPQILHVHAKFYDIDENGQEPAIDYPRARAGVRRGRLPRLLVERMGGPCLRRDAARSTRCCSCASSTT